MHPKKGIFNFSFSNDFNSENDIIFNDDDFSLFFSADEIDEELDDDFTTDLD
jgi:hypothetical protein